MKNKFLEIYRDACIFPFFGFGFSWRYWKEYKGFGIWKDRSSLNIGFWWTISFRSININRKIYLQNYLKR